MRTRAFWALLVTIVLIALGCGGGGDSTSGSSSGSTGGGAPDASLGGSDSGSTGGSKTFTVGGTVTGLSGSGLKLQNGSESLAVSASGAFTFKTAVTSGGAYAVTVATQPSMPTQVCTVSMGSGKATANVTSVAVSCVTSTFTVGGSVAGLSGKGLVLADNNGDDLMVSASGAFTFATPVNSGNMFSVTVKTQPSTPSQTCTVTGGTGKVGSANITSVVVNCQTGSFAIGGQVSGLAGGSVVIEDNGGDDVTVSASGTFAFPTLLASGATYAVTVKTQPSMPTQTCTVTSGTGTVANAAVTSVRIACSTNSYTIGGSLAGLSGTGLVLQDNAGDNLMVTAASGA
ncbi:MAG: hypothetical protein ACREJ3_07470, partial [Polyangiaceae bacterium]